MSIFFCYFFYHRILYFIFHRIVDIVEIVKSVEVAQENIINALLVYVRSICLGFGQRITQSMVNLNRLLIHHRSKRWQLIIFILDTTNIYSRNR